MQYTRYAFFVLSLLWLSLPTAQAQVHHHLTVTLDPVAQRLEVTDRIQVTAHPGQLSLLLHDGLSPRITTPGAVLTTTQVTRDGTVPLQQLNINLSPEVRQFTLQYAGVIHHPVEAAGVEHARSFSISPGLISADGVYLAGSSYWVPQIDGQFLTFEMTVTLPAEWRSVSQGRRTHQDRAAIVRETWSLNKPQPEIYLIASTFEEYREAAGSAEAMVFLRQPDATLARKYLDVTPQYIELYRDLIGPYPYAKFALVESFWETGYGMPSFTLLGPRVIRFPFILHSSYPHEILHNWWGNSVYVDYTSGNWAEGLTSYLADHLIKEQRGQGVAYRRQVLQKYTDYVRDQKDFPLTEFRSRHSSVTEAVGYGKTLMLFHMLRQQLGDQTFVEGLRQLYQQYQFKVASFHDVTTVFDQVSDQSVKPFFDQWVNRIGAPELRVSELQTTPLAEGYSLSGILEQTQDGQPYDLLVPVAVHIAGRQPVYQSQISVQNRRHRFELKVPGKPIRLDIDPEFDVFRRLNRNEIPPALTQAFGATRALMVLSATASDAVKSAYRKLATAWSKRGGAAIEVVTDQELTELPTDRAVWLIGWDNRFRSSLQTAVAPYPANLAAASATVANQPLSRNTHSVVIVARHPKNPNEALTWIATDNTAAIPGLARKLPHYGKYSYLAFTGDAPDNVVKGQWPIIGSPLSVALAPPGTQAEPAKPSKLAPRPALASMPPVFSAQRMMQDIDFFTHAKRNGRGLGSVELQQAADYIAAQFRQAGLQAGGDNGHYVQTWTADVKGLGKAIEMTNIIGVRPGTNPAYQGQSVVLGAHYDHLGRGWPDVRTGNEGKLHPGADDNASGVAVMLEFARALQNWKPERSVIFIAFTGEEAGKLGSQYYVQHASQTDYPTQKVMGMLNLDAVGRLGDQSLLALGAASAREWVHIFRGVGFVTGISVKSVADDYGSSDHSSFIEHGIPAVQLFTGAHEDYHRPSDTPDKIDAAGLVKVATVVKETLTYLASRPNRLTATMPHAPQSEASPPAGRRVLLGTVPDFSFDGKGVKLSGVTAGTPAAQAGLQTGDVITRLNDAAVDNLRIYANLLKSLKPGDAVTIQFWRDGTKQQVTATLTTR